MKWVVTVLMAALVASPALAGQNAAELVGAPVSYSSQPAAPIWHPSRAILYDNGPLVTHPLGGAGGHDASAVQTALGMTLYGFGHQYSLGYRMADDFTIPAGGSWDIQQITFFAYQTGSGTTSSITGVYFEILNGSPAGGGSVVFGDQTTNRMTSTSWSGIYRTLDTDVRTATTRCIMANVCAAAVTLSPGTYWIAWNTNGTLTSGPWAPPVTVLGSTGSGNGLQYLGTTGWGAALDGSWQQDLPFVIEGEGATPNEASTWSALRSLYQ
jgi:hypothetical protein